MQKLAILVLGCWAVMAEGPALATDLHFPAGPVEYNFVEKRGVLEGGRTFAVVAKVRRFGGLDDPLSGVDFLGGERNSPRFVLDRFEMTIEGAPVPVRREAWIDLSDPDLPGGIRVGQIHHLHESCSVIAFDVYGGGDGDAYQVSFLVRNGRVIARKMNRECCEARFEEY